MEHLPQFRLSHTSLTLTCPLKYTSSNADLFRGKVFDEYQSLVRAVRRRPARRRLSLRRRRAPARHRNEVSIPVHSDSLVEAAVKH